MASQRHNGRDYLSWALVIDKPSCCKVTYVSASYINEGSESRCLLSAHSIFKYFLFNLYLPGKSVKNKFLFTMTAYPGPMGLQITASCDTAWNRTSPIGRRTIGPALSGLGFVRHCREAIKPNRALQPHF